MLQGYMILIPPSYQITVLMITTTLVRSDDDVDAVPAATYCRIGYVPPLRHRVTMSACRTNLWR